METDRIDKKLERLRSSFISLLVEQQIEISALQSAITEAPVTLQRMAELRQVASNSKSRFRQGFELEIPLAHDL